MLYFKNQFVALGQIIQVWVAQPWPNTIHSLTPWSRALLEKPTCSQLVKKFPVFYGARRFISAFTSALHLSLLYFFRNLLHHSRHDSNRWVHHQGLIYIYPFALYGFPYSIRQLFHILHCFRKISVQGKRHWSCARRKATKKTPTAI
jgi:hypothetical protein